MTAPSMAEVLGEHQRITSQPGGPCWCGEWPRDNGRRETWMAHVAQALADAGFGHVASVEGEFLGRINAARAVCEDPRHTVRRWIDDTRMVDVPVVLAALNGEADR